MNLNVDKPQEQIHRGRVIVSKAAWVACPNCDDCLCRIHGTHAYDCACPGIEVWAMKEINPYFAGADLPAIEVESWEIDR